MVIGSQATAQASQFPATVAAGDEVTMAFINGGTLMKIRVNDGDRVQKGDLLVQMDSRDAQNQLDSAAAEMKRAKAQMDRMKKAAQVKAVSEQEVSNAEAAYDKAHAEWNIKKKALEDTDLKASFNGIISKVIAKSYQTVQPKESILKLQDLSGLKIHASIPEAFVARLSARDDNEYKYTATFDFLPDLEFDLSFKEFTTEADALTQTFTATFTLISPEEVNILPGMACTVTLTPLKEIEQKKTKGYAVPLNAVPVDGVGQYYVWSIQKTDVDGRFSATRRDVQVGPMDGANILITSGLEKGDRIALAGVQTLREGTIVRLLKPKGKATP
jgi:RND family efflux transporter MFP subunit